MTNITCIRCTNTAPAISGDIPWTGSLAEEIRAKICQICWSAWEEQQVMVINELSLKLFLPEDRARLETAMRDFLQLDLR